MEKKSRKEFKELSEEQLKEVTGGGWFGKLNIAGVACIADSTNPCPSMKFDNQCKCIE